MHVICAMLFSYSSYLNVVIFLYLSAKRLISVNRKSKFFEFLQDLFWKWERAFLPWLRKLQTLDTDFLLGCRLTVNALKIWYFDTDVDTFELIFGLRFEKHILQSVAKFLLGKTNKEQKMMHLNASIIIVRTLEYNIRKNFLWSYRILP